MDIRYLSREEIDKTKWNSCVHYAANGNVFGYIWYLDNVAKEWDALVEGDYESVFPLVWKKTWWGGRKLVQPPWMRELGIYSIHVLSKPRIKAFVDAIPPEFKRIAIHLNEQNFLPEAEGFRMEPQTNYQLLLQPDYEEIADGFSSGFLSQLGRAEKNNLTPVSNLKPERVADFSENTAPAILTGRLARTLCCALCTIFCTAAGASPPGCRTPRASCWPSISTYTVIARC